MWLKHLLWARVPSRKKAASSLSISAQLRKGIGFYAQPFAKDEEHGHHHQRHTTVPRIRIL